jgi:hypothetical protein
MVLQLEHILHLAASHDPHKMETTT